MAGLAEAWAGPVAFDSRKASVKDFANALYGPVPPPPVDVRFTRRRVSVNHTVAVWRLDLSFVLPKNTLNIAAGLWLPTGDGPFPLITGLDFLGPFGLWHEGFQPDAGAIVQAPETMGGLGLLSERHKGALPGRWPALWLARQGYASLVSCYGAWVPDASEVWRDRGLGRWASEVAPEAGALSLWAWAIMRLVDVAQRLDETDTSRLALAGFSRLGKAALWAAAQDARVAAVWACQSGCAGAAPAVHPRGETLAALRARFRHWLCQGGAETPGIDQHQLLACLAPRRLLLSGAREDLWSDPAGTYMALRAASEHWQDAPDWPGVAEMWMGTGRAFGPSLGWHLRDGSHDMTREDWAAFVSFLGW